MTFLTEQQFTETFDKYFNAAMVAIDKYNLDADYLACTITEDFPEIDDEQLDRVCSEAIGCYRDGMIENSFHQADINEGRY